MKLHSLSCFSSASFLIYSLLSSFFCEWRVSTMQCAFCARFFEELERLNSGLLELQARLIDLRAIVGLSGFLAFISSKTFLRVVVLLVSIKNVLRCVSRPWKVPLRCLCNTFELSESLLRRYISQRARKRVPSTSFLSPIYFIRFSSSVYYYKVAFSASMKCNLAIIFFPTITGTFSSARLCFKLSWASLVDGWTVICCTEFSFAWQPLSCSMKLVIIEVSLPSII